MLTIVGNPRWFLTSSLLLITEVASLFHATKQATQPEYDDGDIALMPHKLAWLHTPKAGTSFANVLIAWGCPDKLGMLMGGEEKLHHAAVAHRFCKAHSQDCAEAKALCSSHSPVNYTASGEHEDYNGQIHSWEHSKGNFVGMFRKPEQRHISGFKDEQIMTTFGVHVYHGHYNNVLDYAIANQGCSVKLLNGKPCNDASNATEIMLAQAKDRLDGGFAYVGLTEEWELSVCLFHRMFGGQCDEREFKNTRPGEQREEEEDYDTSILRGWKDPLDGPLYDHARFMFWSNVAKYDVSWESCREQICPEASQFF